MGPPRHELARLWYQYIDQWNHKEWNGVATIVTYYRLSGTCASRIGGGSDGCRRGPKVAVAAATVHP